MTKSTFTPVLSRLRVLALVATLALAACSGGARNPGTPPLSSPSAGVTISIKIPKAPNASSRGPQYVSPATTQMTIEIEQGGVPVSGYPQTIGLTPTSTGCTSTLVDTLCQLAFPLAPGSYTATISLLDASGNTLSGAQSIPFTVIAGANNSIPIVLGGIPHSILVSTESPATSEVQSDSQIAFLGASSVHLSVVATDADGNLILGPGAPTIAASIAAVSSGSGISVSTPSSSAPNTVSLSATGFGSATLTVVATPSSGSALQTQFSVLATYLTTTVAGSPTGGFADGTGSASKFSFLHFMPGINLFYNLVYDSGSGDLYVADNDNCAIRQVTTAGVVTTIAGANPASCGFADGTGSATKFYAPEGIAYDSGNGDLYVADLDNCAIRQVTTSGTVTTIAGANPASCGFADGTGGGAKFYGPEGIAYDSGNGNLYVVDTINCAIRQVTTAGVVTTIAGANPASCGFVDGTGGAAKFNLPEGIAYDTSDGDLYVIDTNNCAIRQVTTAGVVTTIAGANPASCGFADGTGSVAKFNAPGGIAIDSGNGNLYVADYSNCAIRQVTTAGVVTTVAGSPGDCTFATGLDSSIAYPDGITYDASTGLLYITDSNTVQSLQL
ncbi:MAG: hypothetical protein HKL91_06770 [Candidatus Eremiobacteraeota bacterium]|uniref:Uncharacterized protein n=1 Tax=mine drainage metagenome TaxID=410659 RepID=E6PFC9_9ZZZZ|nr:hypothetical protein [Candidatus Eremiobacteraeota bacterium]